MECIIRKPSGVQVQMSLDVLQAQLASGAIHGDTMARREIDAEWSTAAGIADNPSAPPRVPPAVVAASETVNQLVTRYAEAYTVARVASGFGSAISGLGVLCGLGAGGLTLAAGWPNIGWIIGAIVLAVVIGLTIHAVGLLVGAAGALVQAALDTAVNTSPHLSRSEQLAAMRLR